MIPTAERKSVNLDDVFLEVIHYPDYQFFKWCELQYFINRGVYNTIDQFLFETGYKSIDKRRVVLIDFLQYLFNRFANKDDQVLKLGHGNLTNALNQFMDNRFLSKNQVKL